MPFGRRTTCGVALAVVSLLGLSACAGGASGAASQDLAEIQVMMFPGVAYRLPVVIAEQEGYFEDEGVAIKEIPQPNNLPGIQALTSTKSQVGQFSVATVAQAAEAGEKVKMFCGHIGEVQSSVVANIDSDLPNMEEGASWEEVLKALDGKTFGVQVPVGAGFQLITAAAFEEVGVTDVTYVNVGGSNTTTGPALDNGDVEAAIASPPGTQFLTESGNQKVLAYLPDGPAAYRDWYGSGWAAPTAWLEAEPEAAAGFCRAVQRGIDYVQDPANADSVEEALVDDTGLPADIAALIVSSQYEPYSTELPQDVIEVTLKGYAASGVLSGASAVTYESLVDDKTGR
ncbi:ABC transporter substrate-binding protein [Georgenia ruanii]|uniref:SsuA/THI5-like domain-containing protein n=1 Tax=Georgenia ruanii TaxID=348442 RepID=A0A7J9UV58_9MICO|nr:ABC transporter substrate-binding protein [Georgenia ruanii]MPV88496.1 hypothetical protein [Georgenia ruanii]